MGMDIHFFLEYREPHESTWNYYDEVQISRNSAMFAILLNSPVSHSLDQRQQLVPVAIPNEPNNCSQELTSRIQQSKQEGYFGHSHITGDMIDEFNWLDHYVLYTRVFDEMNYKKRNGSCSYVSKNNYKASPKDQLITQSDYEQMVKRGKTVKEARTQFKIEVVERYSYMDICGTLVNVMRGTLSHYPLNCVRGVFWFDN